MIIDQGKVNKAFTKSNFQDAFKDFTYKSRNHTFYIKAYEDIDLLITASFLENKSNNASFMQLDPKIIKDTEYSFTVDLLWEETQKSDYGVVKIELFNNKISKMVEFTYIKMWKELNLRFIDRFGPILCLLLITLIIVGIGARQNQFSFIRDSPESDIYEVNRITLLQAFGILVFASMVLVGFYILIKIFSSIWVITIIFLISISSLMVPFFIDLINSIAARNIRLICDQTILNQNITVTVISSILITFTIIATWCMTHNWVVNNIIGWIAVLVILKTFRLNKLAPGILILSVLFIYDGFWVFLSPYFFGQSVMVEVATKIDLPAKLVFPGFNEFSRGSLIGLGDLAIPGFYINYVTRFGFYHKTQSYYYVHMLAYAMSLLLWIIVVSSGYGGQPALLYIVPALFLSTFILGRKRREIKKLFNGIPSDSQDENSRLRVSIDSSSIEIPNQNSDHIN